ncbi:CaiB/BaiF CoA transferase family protein [Rhodococcus opacus]|uniref:CaiB/BaiF CoA transferase family protein n=1 Tax=Rhodococcus opacus TaxID=37919 RepID=UPI002949028E|nr:CaiB/BaiF CoA-transferase family protein [Rhodococcus opacus]MDV6248124.1 CaiB/BaiF CoA-transferase family protein [Rhodococcus opacus]
MSSSNPKRGPLQGLRVLEIGGMGPTPFAGMTLADMGAEVIRIERPGGLGVFPGAPTEDILNRGKSSVVLDLKSPKAIEALLTMVEDADVLIEGHRPGVAERLGIGPDACRERNPRIVYGRMTGWGQDGPLADTAGHDIDYIAITGALHAIGTAGGPPQIPVNLVGDFGGGGMYLVSGILAALWEVRETGRGRVVDAAIVDGAAHLLAGIHAMANTGTWADERGVNMLDGGAPYYAVYETADGKYIAAGAVEPKFYAQLLNGLGLAEQIDVSKQNDRATWPATRADIATAFARRSRDDWEQIFAGTDACVAPIVGLREAMAHPHIKARGTIIERDGLLQAAPAPRFEGFEQSLGTPPPQPGQHTSDVLTSFGIDPEPLLALGVPQSWNEHP